MRPQKLRLSLLFILSFLVSLIMTPTANAGHNWNIIQIHQETKEASKLIYLAFSSVFQSFELLEQGNLRGANSLFNEKVLPNIQYSKNVYEKYASSLSNEYRDLIKAIPSQYQPMIFKDLGRYGIPFPSSLRDLAIVADRELEDILNSFNQVRFVEQDEMRNRDIMRKINDKITRFINLGISFSTISMFNPN